jgi:deazaflavin-dependent oxidoreductase (nitroreductase family)
MSDANNWNQKIIEEFRANDGQVGGHFENMPLVLLHTTGAKSGKERVNPLAYIRDDDKLAIVASKGGAPTNPDWYYNILAHPEVKVEVGTDVFNAKASVTEEPKRTELFNKMAAKNPVFAGYEDKTTRTIPVITLTRQ